MADTSNSSAVFVLNTNDVVSRPSHENIAPFTCTPCIICDELISIHDNYSSLRVCNNCKKAVMKVRSDMGWKD